MEESTKRPLWQEDYNDAFNKLISSREIIDWKTNRALEAAKSISVNQEFQNGIQIIREKYHIQSNIEDNEVLADVVLYKYTNHLEDDVYLSLIKDLEDLAKKHNLNWKEEDQGLIVAALCYGITPENINKHWDVMKLLIARTRNSGVQIIIDDHIRIKEKLLYMMLVSHLYSQLIKNGGEILLPDSLKTMIIDAVKSVGIIDTKDRAEAIVQKVKNTDISPDLYIKISKNTTIKDVQRTWPQVKLRQLELFRQDTPDKLTKRKRRWRTYERDIFIWHRVKLDGLTYDAAYNEWLESHPEEKRVDTSAVIKSVSKIDALKQGD